MAEQEDSTTEEAQPETDEATTNAPSPEDIKRMQAALKKANKEAETARRKVKELEDRDKDEATRLAEQVTEAQKRADEAEGRAMRLEVAASKGLTPAQARRLVGSTQEELEADADELLTSFAPPEPTPRPSDTKPIEQLTPAGADSASGGDDIDYDALARNV